MQIKLLALGKTDNKAIQDLIEDYSSRLGHYIRFELEVIPDLKQSKSLSEALQKEKEGELILKKLGSSDELILLDERGKSYSSLEYADFLQKKMNSGLCRAALPRLCDFAQRTLPSRVALHYPNINFFNLLLSNVTKLLTFVYSVNISLMDYEKNTPFLALLYRNCYPWHLPRKRG